MNIIINGGTRGIGREVVNCLAQDIGNQILVTGRNIEALKDLSGQFKNVKSVPLDMSLFDSQSDRFKDVVSSNFRYVDILINLAGNLIAKEFVDISNNEARLMMETNFFGPASVIRILKPMMPSGSHIVNISSMGGFQGSIKYRGLSYYSASKSALACLTECLSSEFSEFGIKVNCLALGSVQTEMFDEAFPGYKAPVDAKEMAEFISNFALTGHRFFNGKILPVALGNP
jgi:NAD(P)-dependent dehydrogenase (short-subunit alcohol dehydrogenase family)